VTAFVGGASTGCLGRKRGCTPARAVLWAPPRLRSPSSLLLRLSDLCWPHPLLLLAVRTERVFLCTVPLTFLIAGRLLRLPPAAAASCLLSVPLAKGIRAINYRRAQVGLHAPLPDVQLVVDSSARRWICGGRSELHAAGVGNFSRFSYHISLLFPKMLRDAPVACS
jgi:hypothetical protein